MDPQKANYHDQWVIPGITMTLTLVFLLLGYLEDSDSYTITTAAFAVNFVYTLFAVLVLRGIIMILDKWYSWHRNMTQRFIIQLLLTSIIYLCIQSAILFSTDSGQNGAPVRLVTIVTVYAVGLIAVLLVNILYLRLFLRHQKSSFPGGLNKANFISAKEGSKRLSILPSEMVFVFLENTLVKAQDQAGRKLLLQDSLSDLEEVLDPEVFFRANRQAIITKPIIEEVKYNDNKSCSLSLSTTSEPVIISRHKAPKFKKWLKD